MGIVTARTSTIFVNVDGRLEPYQSWPEVPIEMRRRLRKSSVGRGRVKIIIANRRGRAIISKALQESRPPRGARPVAKTALSPSRGLQIGGISFNRRTIAQHIPGKRIRQRRIVLAGGLAALLILLISVVASWY